MLRLPWFEHRAPRSVAEAAKILAGEGPRAMLIAGGTDLLPNMKRRHQAPQVLISIRNIEKLKEVNGTFGSAVTLNEVVRNPKTPTALRQAAVQVATPHLRNMGTLGGNLCLDTRCNYYNQTYEWRKAIDFCLKKDGKVCWVATASKRCVAVSSTDTAPALIALDAAVTLVSSSGERERRHRLPVAPAGRNPDASQGAGGLEEHVLEAAPQGLVRLPDPGRRGCLAFQFFR
jgi:4-hydroxybenzoyl-CoA reductase subunit beta